MYIQHIKKSTVRYQPSVSDYLKCGEISLVSISPVRNNVFLHQPSLSENTINNDTQRLDTVQYSTFHKARGGPAGGGGGGGKFYFWGRLKKIKKENKKM
jgi:hypothetical protein